MNPLPFVIGGAVVTVAVVPALRDRVVPVASAVTGGAFGVAGSTVKGVLSVAGSAAGALGGVAKAAWDNPSKPEA